MKYNKKVSQTLKKLNCNNIIRYFDEIYSLNVKCDWVYKVIVRDFSLVGTDS